MSWRAMQEMLKHSEAQKLHRTVGLAVASYANLDTGLTWPSNKTLLAEWGLDERTVQRGLRVLENLGELRRQPQMESRERPRVYLIDAFGSRQLSMLDNLADRQTPVQTGVQTPVYSRERGSEPFKPEGTTPGTPLAGGNALLTASSMTTDAPHGAAAARSRRRRRRAAMRDVSASEPCPLDGNGGNEGEVLAELWALAAVRIREALGEQTWDVWFARAHPHRLDGDALVVAIHPDQVSWARDRFRRVVESERPVALVGCERLRGGAR